MKTVSLIVPVYNAGAYLAPLVRSALSQSYGVMQLILSDDGSTDGSLAVMEQLAREDARITVVTGPNGGVSSARNRALNRAEGDYIGFLDADDLLEPEYLSTLVGLLETHTADCACCGFTRIYASSGVEDHMPVGQTEVADTDWDGFRRLLLHPRGYTTVVWNKLFRREALQNADGSWIPFDETLHIVEDGEYLFRCHVQRAVFTPKCLYRYTVRTSGAMYGALNDRKRTELTARKAIVQLCADAPADIRALAEMKYQKGVRDLLFHAVIGGQGKEIRTLLPELKVFSASLFHSPALSNKEKLKYHIYRPIIQLNLRHIGSFLMKHLSGHG